MRLRVRQWLSALALLTVVISATGFTQTRFVDDATREVQLPPRVGRVFAAGAPAEVLLYTLVPDTLVGRNRVPNGDAIEFFPPAYRNPSGFELSLEARSEPQACAPAGTPTCTA